MANWIAFIRAKSFYVQVCRRLQPLSGLRPLVVICNGQVLEACGRAEAEGVRGGIPLQQARCLCPQADIVAFFNPNDCLPLYRQIWDIVAAHSPVVEPTDFHQGFADVTKVVRGSHQAEEWRSEVSKQIQQHTGSEPSIGMAPNRFIAQLAAAHNSVVGEEDVADFIASIPSLHIDWLDTKLIEALERLGLTTLGKVVAVSRNALIQQVGMAGGQLHDWITGRDNRPVQPLYPPDEERVVHNFDAEDSQEVIFQTLNDLCQQLAGRLHDTGRQPRRLTLQLEDTADCCTHTQQYSRPLKGASRLYEVAEQLVKQLWQGQPLLQMELAAADLVLTVPHQPSLWSSRRHAYLEQAVEAARSRYGAQAVNRASQLEDKRRFAQMILGEEGRFSW